MSQLEITGNQLITSEKSFFTKLAHGDFGLAKTYWLFGVLVSITVNIVSNFFITSIGGLFLLTLSYAAYDIPVILGTWRAAKKYQGSTLWANMAKTMSIVGAIMLVVVLVLLLAMLAQA